MAQQRRCQQKFHEDFQVEYLCVYPQCQSSKLFCSECFADDIHRHSQQNNQHIMTKKKFMDMLNLKLSGMNQYLGAHFLQDIQNILKAIQEQIQQFQSLSQSMVHKNVQQIRKLQQYTINNCFNILTDDSINSVLDGQSRDFTKPIYQIQQLAEKVLIVSKSITLPELELQENLLKSNKDIVQQTEDNIANYFSEIKLSPHDFDPKYNIEYGINHKEFELKGPKHDQLKYFFPRGWKGYALNVKGKYNRDNDDWLKKDGNQNQWLIMFHGTQQEFLKDIIQQGLKLGDGQIFKNGIDLRGREIIGSGVYVSNHIEVNTVNQYKLMVLVTNQCFSVEAILKNQNKQKNLQILKRNREIQIGIMIILFANSTEDIRPYRILLKKVEM